MIALQPGRNRFIGSRGFTVAVTVVCLLLLALLAVGQVAHVHPSASDADHCALCIALHSAAPVAAAAAIVIVLVQLGTPVLLQEVPLVIRPWHPTLYTRPPPSR
ncbi:MAG TPA: hypothetical protein VG267_18900 [Terracidiphilus sp.]|nr:hypothetical protein [Terracidiphilus sp.]